MKWQFPGYKIGEALDWQSLSTEYSWINSMKGVEQDHWWHAEGDVFVHTQMVVDELTSLPEFNELPT